MELEDAIHGGVMSFLATDPVRRAVEAALAAVAGGRDVSDVESDLVDFKEDPSMRTRGGAPGPARDEGAALMVAEAAACMSNSGGGGVIVGVRDSDGELTGTNLDPMWLRGRIHDLSDRRLTCAVEEVPVGDHRLLVILAPQAWEPIRIRGKAKHRVGGRCVEIDASQWAAAHLNRVGFDWSAQASGVPVDRVRPAALGVARQYLRTSGEQRAAELAAASDEEFLRRTAAIKDGVLTNGATLLFTAEADCPTIDYRRRDAPGADSVLRLDRTDVSLIEALAEVERAIALTNRTVHVRPGGLPVGQLRAVPEKAVREALANAVAHRDWLLPEPVAVEFVGDCLVVQSPGGFAEGVDSDRLLTTPPRTRNPHLADLLRLLRIAEREGIGVDRMYREMIRVGHRPPEIVERPGPHVRCALIGGEPNVPVMRLMTALDPPQHAEDVDIALIVDVLRRRPTVSARELIDVLQKEVDEAASALDRARDTRFGDGPMIIPTVRTQQRRTRDYRFSDTVRWHFGRDLPYLRMSRDEVVPYVADFVRQYGQIRNSDYVDLFGVSQQYAARVLRELASPDWGGLLRPGREPNIGRDAHYVAGPGFPATLPTVSLGRVITDEDVDELDDEL